MIAPLLTSTVDEAFLAGSLGPVTTALGGWRHRGLHVLCRFAAHREVLQAAARADADRIPLQGTRMCSARSSLIERYSAGPQPSRNAHG